MSFFGCPHYNRKYKTQLKRDAHVETKHNPELVAATRSTAEKAFSSLLGSSCSQGRPAKQGAGRVYRKASHHKAFCNLMRGASREGETESDRVNSSHHPIHVKGKNQGSADGPAWLKKWSKGGQVGHANTQQHAKAWEQEAEVANAAEKERYLQASKQIAEEQTKIVEIVLNKMKKDREIVEATQARNARILELTKRMDEDGTSCVICMDKLRCMALVPCGHAVFCATCAPSLQTCPICRKKVDMHLALYQ